VLATQHPQQPDSTTAEQWTAEQLEHNLEVTSNRWPVTNNGTTAQRTGNNTVRVNYGDISAPLYMEQQTGNM
jgi:hypothetical protein